MTRKEAIEMLRNNVCNSHHVYDNALPTIIEALETLIPELAESEDEKIKKELLCHIQGEIDTYDNMISGDYDSRDKEDKKVHSMLKRAKAYLEKQKERGPLSKDEEYTLARIIEYLEDNDCPPEWKDLLHDVYSLPYQKEQKTAEWSEEDETRLKVIKEELERYIMFNQYGTPLSVDDLDWLKNLPERFNPQPKQEWSEEDEKKKWIPKFKVGDLFIYNDMRQEAKIYKVKRVVQGGCVSGYWCEQFGIPANGNVWFSSFEEEYMKPYEPEPRQEWSEEDRIMLNTINADVSRTLHSCGIGTDEHQIRSKAINFLKSLCPQPKQEWSEKRKKELGDYLFNMIKLMNTGAGKLRYTNDELEKYVEKCVQDVIDLCPISQQTTWKPSEEQLEALYNVEFKNFKKFGPILESLYYDLLQLKEKL